jgi:hypothetical protein
VAEFGPAFEKSVRTWERLVLTNNPGDRGGQTYAGISRRFWPGWAGWALIDAGRDVPDALVATFYQAQFWDAVEGDRIDSQPVAEVIFDWAIQRGEAKARALTLEVLGLPLTLGMLAAVRELNNLPTARPFVMAYGLRRIAHRERIVTSNPGQAQFLLGWLRRDLTFSLAA